MPPKRSCASSCRGTATDSAWWCPWSCRGKIRKWGFWREWEVGREDDRGKVGGKIIAGTVRISKGGKNGGSFLHETAFLDAIPADFASQSNATNGMSQSNFDHFDHFDHFDNFDNFDHFDNLERTSFIEIPQLSGFSVSLIFRFPRLFYLSNSRDIRFVDKEKPRFDSLFVRRIRSNPS